MDRNQATSVVETLVPVCREAHREAGWERFSSLGFARAEILAPLAAAEVAQAALTMPLVFTRWPRPQGEAWRVCGLMGLTPGNNLFVGPDGRWLGRYIPAALRSHPFTLAPDDSLQVHREAVIPGGAEHVEPFFSGGELAPLVAETREFLRQVRTGQERLATPVAMLEQLGILAPFRFPSTGSTPVAVEALDGFYAVGEDGLNGLDGGDWQRLRESGGTPLAYAQLISMGHATTLQRLAQISWPKPQAAPARGATVSSSADEVRDRGVQDFLGVLAAHSSAEDRGLIDPNEMGCGQDDPQD